MKKITIFLSFALVALFALGQTQDDLRKAHAEREALL